MPSSSIWASKSRDRRSRDTRRLFPSPLAVSRRIASQSRDFSYSGRREIPGAIADYVESAAKHPSAGSKDKCRGAGFAAAHSSAVITGTVEGISKFLRQLLTCERSPLGARAQRAPTLVKYCSSLFPPAGRGSPGIILRRCWRVIFSWFEFPLCRSSCRVRGRWAKGALMPMRREFSSAAS